MYTSRSLLLVVTSVIAYIAPLANGQTDRSNTCKQIQHNFPPGTNSNQTRAEAIKAAYLRSWNQYSKYAFGYDDILPVTNEPVNDFYGWGLTIIDGLDTAIVMGLTDVVDRMLSHISTVNFSQSADLPDEFDVIIRYIGGLLSAHDLITSGRVPNATHYNKGQVAALVKGAQTLGNLLKPVFTTPSGLPYFFLNTTTHQPSNGPFPYTDPLNNQTYVNITNTAQAGTIILEFHRLSDLTGDQSFRQLADRAESHLINPKPAPVYPGIVGSELNLITGEFFAHDAGWQSGIDSFYEYLIKSAIYDPSASTATAYRNSWIQAVDSTAQHLATHPHNHPELTFITQLNASGSPMYYMDDYACFTGGNLLLGGAYLDRPDFLSLGLAVTDSCHALFNSTASGLNPLTIAWYGPHNELGAGQTATPNDTASAAAHGFFVVDALYTLYPEPIESLFYAWRVTGDPRWREYAWQVFEAMQRDGNRGDGVPMSCLGDVTQPLGGGRFNYLPSYYFAETLKYLYLIFAPTDLVSLDDFVFNTECHPLRIQRGTCSSPSPYQEGETRRSV